MTQNADDLEFAISSLAERIGRFHRENGPLNTLIPSLTLSRLETPTDPVSYMMESSICLIVQGVKRVLLGEEVYVYNTHNYLITSVGLPVVAQVLEASGEKPYLGLRIEFNQREIVQLMVDNNLPSPRTQQASRGMALGEVSLPLLDAFRRLLDLLDQPDDIPILAPLIQREILYRLLVGEQGPRLRQIGAVGSQSHQIAKAITWLKDNFTRQMHIDELAAEIGMSTSTFHHHFRALTAMSPLQFQKRLRLNEARTLMLAEHLDAATAAFQVGYESPSQFSREYSRTFGAPPSRDIKELSQISSANVTV
jgi:AraC-like DNA-binding protein